MRARRRRERRKWAARRFARPEPLEPRIVLDGSAELAVIQPDQANRIGYELDTTFLDALVASTTDSRVAQETGRGTPPGRGTVTWGNGLIFIDLSRIVSDGDYVVHGGTAGDWNSLKTSDTRDESDGHRSEESDRTTTQWPGGYAPGDGWLASDITDRDDITRTGGSDDPAPSGVQDTADREPLHTQTGTESRSRDWVSDGGLVNAPAVIPPPPTAADFLPYEALVQTDRDLTPTRIHAPQRGHGTLASSRSPTATPAVESEREPSPPARQTLSHDAYFVAYEARQPVDWTAQTAASQSRQHVQARDQGRDAPSDEVTSAVSRWRDTVPTIQLPEVAQDAVLVADRDRLTRANEEQIAAARDRFFKRYEPMSVLAGISLVSAHLIADLRTTREDRSRGRRGALVNAWRQPAVDRSRGWE